MRSAVEQLHVFKLNSVLTSCLRGLQLVCWLLQLPRK
eukprot:CAMPEP_0197680770 /NCGR_PEP_ID=MMETSP1338-20131121/93854_1 /TAXON_ID=43686 ORGANISM="Pelagodinium beii, Strain RCC1491" /NCGR_SAMPLE_ID=MMETSP1338 /ASSEMBLY_ACC=CAM_ASM_000754 /LENGTH=36 /DNA_ID= /DNA_START= /DNA_END= /DNA_ORIENTATION=